MTNELLIEVAGLPEKFNRYFRTLCDGGESPEPPADVEDIFGDINNAPAVLSEALCDEVNFVYDHEDDAGNGSGEFYTIGDFDNAIDAAKIGFAFLKISKKTPVWAVGQIRAIDGPDIYN